MSHSDSSSTNPASLNSSKPIYSARLAKWVFVFGIAGVMVNFVGIALKDTNIFLWSQCLGSLTALLYDRFLLGRYTKLAMIVAVVGVASTVTGSEFLFYAGVGIRSFYYQVSFWLFCQKNEVF